MWAAAASSSRITTFRILRYCRNSLPPFRSFSTSSSRFSAFGALDFALDANPTSYAPSNTSGGRARGRARGWGGGRRFHSEFGGYTVRMDKKQRYSLVEENGELLIRANQGHSLKIVDTKSLLKPIISAEEVSLCVHGTYREYLDAILEHGLKRMNRLHVHFSCGLPTNANVTSGMRCDVDVLIFLDVKKAMQDGMKFYFSENKVILTEGFNGVIPVKYFEQIESWASRRLLQMPKREGELTKGIQNIRIK